MSSKKTSKVGSIISFITSGLFVLAAILLYFNAQRVTDQIAVWSYTPSTAIEEIAHKAEFTSKGRFIFYATAPTVEDSESFNKSCPRQEVGSPILGCYTQNDNIFIYNVTNPQLDGMKEVTAAHEMLHAVWSRTSAADRKKLSAELRAAYEKINDEALTKRMEYYQRTEPTEYDNELHSILGTEVENLDGSLNTYYNRFFNRETILKLQKQYGTLYEGLYAKAEDLYKKMETLSQSLEARNKAYNDAVTRYTEDVSSFNGRANSGQFTSQSQFAAERSALMERLAVLDADREAINADVAVYNTYRSEYQDLAREIEVLNNSIDSFSEIEKAPTL